MKITIFGTGSPTKEQYDEAYALGKKIAESGHVLTNGGYAGVMEASAKGATKNGGKAIGVCIKGHSIAYAKKPNDFLSEVIIKDNMGERLKELLKSDKIIVLPGKVGTLEDFFTAWVEAFVDKTNKIYLVGEKNKKLINFLIDNNFVNKDEHLPFIKIVNSIDELPFLNKE